MEHRRPIFEWDWRKAASNVRKHRIRFEDALRVFADPLRSMDIEGHEHGEIRWKTTGEIDGKIVVVSHTLREDGDIEVIRIISARKATPREHRAYRGDTSTHK